MKIIILEGDSQSGKSCALNLVYALLLNLGAIVDSNHFVYLEGLTSDFRSVLQYCGKKIGVITQGDYSLNNLNDLSIIDHLKWAKDKSCDIVVCARSKDKSDSIEDLEKLGYNIEKVVCKTKDIRYKMEANTKDTMEILRLIHEIIKN